MTAARTSGVLFGVDFGVEVFQVGDVERGAMVPRCLGVGLEDESSQGRGKAIDTLIPLHVATFTGVRLLGVGRAGDDRHGWYHDLRAGK